MGDPIYFNSTGSFQRDELSVASYEYGVCHLAEGGCITIRVGNWPACFDMSCREGAVTVGINHFNGEFIDPGKYLLGRGKSSLAFRDVNDLSKVYYAHVKNTIVFQRLFQQCFNSLTARLTFQESDECVAVEDEALPWQLTCPCPDLLCVT